MTSTDRIVVGGTLIACGLAAGVQGWPLLPACAVGSGLGMLLVGLSRALRGER